MPRAGGSRACHSATVGGGGGGGGGGGAVAASVAVSRGNGGGGGRGGGDGTGGSMVELLRRQAGWVGDYDGETGWGEGYAL